MTPENVVLTGDCVEVMATFAPDSIDAIVTDPPYDLTTQTRNGSASTFVDNPYGRARIGTKEFSPRGGFMGKTWDGTGVAFDPRTWAEALRVAKPGAHLLAFGGTRTYHRLAVAIEDAGWEIRDCLVWAYASGFPKSLNLPGGLGTALKPAWEPIVMARKPLGATVAATVERFGTGALNIDATRIGTTKDVPASPRRAPQGPAYGELGNDPGTGRGFDPDVGRWPANVILTDPIFDGGWDGVVGGGYQESTAVPGAWAPRGAFPIDNPTPTIYGDSGTYSRFFLIPKAARSDREPVLGTLAGLPEREVLIGAEGHKINPMTGLPVVDIPRANIHPTVKPTELMRHLVRLVTPPGGLVLDCFGGSGTTALAAEQEGFRWLLIEREAEYVAIAEARLNGTQRGLGLA